MRNANAIQENYLRRIKSHCSEKHYQLQQSDDENKIRLDICNLTEKTIINLYNNGTVLIQGKTNSLNQEMKALKASIELSLTKREQKACSQIYEIMLVEIRKTVRNSLRDISSNCEINETPSTHIEYRARISSESGNIVITQYSNGKLMLQGKTDSYFELCCDHIERIAQPSNKDIAARFVCDDQEILDAFVAKYTPEIMKYAEDEVISILGNSYSYLESYDQKWYIASKCLCHCGIILPEYSPFVMPSSKAFEGFSKKLIVGIGLVPIDHFSTKTANFAILKDKNNATRRGLCTREKYVESFLDRLSNSLDSYRNFMMHSDESFATKVENPQKAISLVEDIMKTQRELFDYFKEVFKLKC